MKKNILIYRVLLHIPPHGTCTATVREYPEYSLIGGDLEHLMHRVKTELPEFLYLMSCSKRSYRPPKPVFATDKAPVGYHYHNCEIVTIPISGELVRHELRISESQCEIIDKIVEEHGYFGSTTHFLTWAALRAAELLNNTFLEDASAYLNTAMDPHSSTSHLVRDQLRLLHEGSNRDTQASETETSIDK